MTPPRPPLQSEYHFKSFKFIGQHVTQVAVDQDGEYSVATTSNPLDAATKLREIADHIEHMENNT